MKVLARVSTVVMVYGLALLNPLAREKDRVMDLRFVPQESTGAPSPTLSGTMVARPASLLFEDGRQLSDKAIIGEGTGDDDEVFIWRTSNDVKAFAEDVFLKTVPTWGVQLDPKAELLLNVKLMQYFVREADQAVGSTYAAEARVVFALKASAGEVLAEGTAAGSAHRYGRKRSAENCSEVLSDAIKEAYAKLIDDSRLQTAWGGKRVEALVVVQGVSPAELLIELQGLKSQGFSADLLVDYVSKKTIRSRLTVDDLTKWKEAGMPEAVIRAAILRAPSDN